MYNLLISFDEDAWDGNPFMISEDRCVKEEEYTNKDIVERYGELAQFQINEIKQLPCIFAYELGCRKNPKFGLIHEIIKRQGKVKISYKIINLDKFLTYSEFTHMGFELDIAEYEFGRTHWAIKDINLSKELINKGIKLNHK